MFRRGLAVLLAVLIMTHTAGASEVGEKIAGFAREIARLLKDEKQSEVAIGEFTGPPLPATSAGPMIQSALIAELTKIKVKVNEAAFIVVKGEYYVLDTGRTTELTVRLELTVRTNAGKKIDELKADVGFRGNKDLVEMLAINTDLSNHTKADREKQNEKIKQDLKNPPLKLADTKIKTSSDSVFALEVLKQTGGALKALTPVEKKGLAFVTLERGDEYVLRVTNGAPFEVAVSVTVDGLNTFHFFDGVGRKPHYYLIPAGGHREITGWTRDKSTVNAFQIGKFADSAAAKVLKSSAKVGTVTVCIHPSWEKDKTPPQFEGTRSADPDGTILGRQIKEKSHIVPRTVGPLLTAISVRYGK